MAAKADLTIKNNRGDTALDLAIKKGLNNIVKDLIEAGIVYINAQNIMGTNSTSDGY